MGERARELYLRRTTPSQRFEHGLSLSNMAIRNLLARHGITEIRTPEEARRAFLILRSYGG